MDTKYHRPLAIIASIGFVLSIIVHSATFLDIDLIRRFPWVMWLNFGMFVVFPPLLFSTDNKIQNRDEIWQKIMASMPLWAKIMMGVSFVYAFVYAFINLTLSIILSGSGNATLEDGRYLLRGFSGHWMIFYLIPALFFGLPRDEGENIEGPEHDKHHFRRRP